MFRLSHIDITWDVHTELPILVLCVEGLMLYKMLEEGKERENELQARRKTEEELKRIRELFGREHYLLHVGRLIKEAQHEFRFTSVSMMTSGSSPDQKVIFDATVEKKGSTFQHLGIIAARPNILPGAIELSFHANVKLRVSPVAEIMRVRFHICDTDKVAFGICDDSTEPTDDKPSNRSISIASRTVANAMKNQFELLWNNSTCVFTFIDSILETSSATLPKQSVLRIERLLGLEGIKVPVWWLCYKSPKCNELVLSELLDYCSNRTDIESSLATKLKSYRGDGLSSDRQREYEEWSNKMTEAVINGCRTTIPKDAIVE